MTKKVDRAQ